MEYVIVVRPGYQKFWAEYAEIMRKAFWDRPWEFTLWDSSKENK